MVAVVVAVVEAEKRQPAFAGILVAHADGIDCAPTTRGRCVTTNTMSVFFLAQFPTLTLYVSRCALS